jgi:two-component system LytT family sensor kinase
VTQAYDPTSGRRPILDRYLIANISLWVLTFLLITMRAVIGMDTPLPRILDMAARRAGVAASAVLVCIAIQQVLLRTRAWPMPRRIVLALGLSIVGVTAWALINFAAFYLIAPYKPWTDGLNEWFLSAILSQGSVLIWSFIAWSAIVFALDYDQQAREHALRLVEAQALAAESQNQMLRYQINPHFLFNTLNALSSLILQKDFVRAERMVLSLSNFLRASLEKAPGDKITLAEELAAQRQYLAIEQERFGERLNLAERVPDALQEALVPGLILQPLLENAVKYGVARTRKPVGIEIAAEAQEGRLVVTVQDDAVADLPDEPQTLGVGLSNVRRRLEVLYGEAGRLTAGPRPGGGFAAAIELPLERR